MRVPELTTRRIVLVGTFLCLFGGTSVAFAQVTTGHLAAMHVQSSEITVIDYEVADDDKLHLTVRMHNPTTKDVDVGTAQLNAYVDGEQVTDGTTTRLDDASVPSEETTDLKIPLELRDGVADRLRNADPEQVEIEGRFKTYVVEEMVYVSLDGTEVDG
ncbi:hypothetical protein [Halorussus litoreus]|uniref:hypothetical protein n=1 Tax=Halorussus litoreus TaxID=1710536 RepID=UPI000E25735B|nr:hypothetical protein [Halorussus litoreus]